MSTWWLANCLMLFGILGLIFLSIASIRIFWYYRDCRPGSFRWHIRNHYLKQIAAVACLFCLAMAASYSLLWQAWAILYIIISFKIGTWWLRLTIDQRS
ncbi:hypothetical protein KDA_00790 [Dictyobacter alpinus]|uniref:DUF3325 domain-containing protein n=1 Tax=Dictyobacter alpinus TaxID=2014873 RepID=A0A402AZU1_9CHLR|nr:hypothetical protein [Dictyobacter alpinus]GCE24595.1 hypothetical protein KDA_00790 [Dictyobacter alpinus]